MDVFVTLVVNNAHGQIGLFYVATMRTEATDALLYYVRDRWEEEYLGPLPDDTEVAINLYFDGNDDEWFAIRNQSIYVPSKTPADCVDLDPEEANLVSDALGFASDQIHFDNVLRHQLKRIRKKINEA